MSDSEFTLTNSNVLEGVECPQCGQSASFEVVAKAWFTLSDEGTESYKEVDWDDTAPTRCPACKHLGPMSIYRMIPPETETVGLVVKLSGAIEKIAPSLAGRFTVSDLEDALGGRYEYSPTQLDDHYFVTLENQQNLGERQLNTKIKRRFGVDLHGPVVIVRKGLIT